jgi:hypothetical protein
MRQRCRPMVAAQGFLDDADMRCESQSATERNFMNRKNLIASAASAVVALLAATSFSAQAMPGGAESYGESPAPTASSTLTREAVLAEVLASKQRLSADKAYGAEPVEEAPSTLTREEVIADLMAAKADGRMDPGGEFSTPDSVIAAQVRYAHSKAAASLASLEPQPQVLALQNQTLEQSAQTDMPDMPEMSGTLGSASADLSVSSSEATAQAMSDSVSSEAAMDRGPRRYFEVDESGIEVPFKEAEMR